MILIADVDNCFVSCERRRNPELEGKPVIVLSAGKAAVIARSNEAKHMGIKMGEPYFKMSGRFAPKTTLRYLPTITITGRYRPS